MRLDHVVIAVSDWERSNAFYRDVLGAELIEKRDGGPSRRRAEAPGSAGCAPMAYRFGDQQLNVHGPGMAPHPVAARPEQPGGADLCLVWEGAIEEAAAHLAAHGVEVEEGPVTRFGGRGQGTSVYFRDPDGSLLEFISYAGR